METLHAAHQGETGMTLLAQTTVFWPGISKEIEKTRKTCDPCIHNAPSQPKSTPFPPIIPTTPFEAVVADYFQFEGHHYLVIGDRLSAWTEVYHIHVGSNSSGSHGLVTLIKNFCGTFGVPVELSSDQGKEFVADETQDFFLRWGIRHRDSAAYNPQSNGRAELAVKSTKRLLENNIGSDGKLNTDRFIRALLTKRNTPDPTSKVSPAEIIFGRNLRDTLPRVNKETNVFHNTRIRPEWRDAWAQKENALRSRYQGCQQRLAEHSRDLPPLIVGDRVSIQNQTGHRPTKWERTGSVVEVRDHNKYVIRVDGSGRLTIRNRRFLRKLYQDKTMFASPKPSPQPAMAVVPPHINDQSPLPLQDVPTVNRQSSPPVPSEPVVDEIPSSAEYITPPDEERATPMSPQSSIWKPDRPTRTRQPLQLYDADTGTYKDRTF